MAKANGCTMRAGPWDQGCGKHGERFDYEPHVNKPPRVRVQKYQGAMRKHENMVPQYERKTLVPTTAYKVEGSRVLCIHKRKGKILTITKTNPQ